MTPFVHRRRLALYLVLALLAGCQPTGDDAAPSVETALPAPAAAEDRADARSAIDAINLETGELIRSGKGNAVAGQYTADALLMPANAPAVGGTEAIGAQFQAVVDGGVTDLTLTASEVESREGLAVEIGRYRGATANGATVDEGKYIVVWRREGSGWKRHRDFFSSDMPPPGLLPDALPVTPAAE